MGPEAIPEESGENDGAFEGGSVRATWRLSLMGESEAIRDPAAVRTSAGAPLLRAGQHFLADLPAILMDRLDVTAGTNAVRSWSPWNKGA